MLDGCCQLYTPPHHVRPKTSSLRVKFVIIVGIIFTNFFLCLGISIIYLHTLSDAPHIRSILI